MQHITTEFEGAAQFDAATLGWVDRTTRATEDALPHLANIVKGGLRPQHEVTHRLGDSVISKDVRREGKGAYSIDIGPTAPQTRVIERGRKSGKGRGAGWRKPKPWFIPGFDKIGPKLHDALAAAWAKAGTQ